jgi:hypothetical protein
LCTVGPRRIIVSMMVSLYVPRKALVGEKRCPMAPTVAAKFYSRKLSRFQPNRLTAPTVAAHISVEKTLPYSGQFFPTARRGGPRRSRTSAPKVTSYRFHVLTRVMSLLLLEAPSVPRAATARDGTTDFYHAIHSHGFRSHSPAERTEGAMHPEGGEPVAT